MNGRQPDIRYSDPGNGRRLAYRLRPGSAPTLLFLPGYASDMDGAKAIALDGFAESRGIAMLRFDYSGTGQSGGSFEDGTLAGWLDEALAMVDRHTDGPIIPIGSSMGAWIALHLAIRVPDKVQALVGIAAAPDFTDWGYTPEDKDAMARDGKLERSEVSGGSFTISNHGVSGSLLAAPIILHQGQAAILGIGKLEKRVVVREVGGQDAILVRPMAYVTLTIDHRVVDGHQTNAWLSRFVEILESWPA